MCGENDPLRLERCTYKAPSCMPRLPSASALSRRDNEELLCESRRVTSQGGLRLTDQRRDVMNFILKAVLELFNDFHEYPGYLDFERSCSSVRLPSERPKHI